MTTLTMTRQAYERDGFARADVLVDPAALARLAAGMDRVIAGEYDTGRAPIERSAPPGDTTGPLIKIDSAHWSDSAIVDVVTSSAIGEAAAALTGAREVRLWMSQLLVKHPDARGGVVGWHQDDNYWKTWWEGEVLTCWLAVADVPPDAGPLSYIRGSHRWGPVPGDFSSDDLAALAARIGVPDGEVWDAVETPLPAGAAAFHHRMTIHGSTPNTAAAPRVALALHLCTERARSLGRGNPFDDYLDDPSMTPVLYRA